MVCPHKVAENGDYSCPKRRQLFVAVFGDFLANVVRPYQRMFCVAQSPTTRVQATTKDSVVGLSGESNQDQVSHKRGKCECVVKH